jgi:hypothetical protein
MAWASLRWASNAMIDCQKTPLISNVTKAQDFVELMTENIRRVIVR